MNTTTPKKCPKCGCEMTVECDGRPMHVGRNWSRDDYSFCLEKQRDQLAERVRVFEAALSDPAAVWANMLRGTIATPPHIPELEGRLTDAHVRIQELEAALDLVIPNCDYLHHEKKHRHLSHELCPVLEIIMKAKGLK